MTLVVTADGLTAIGIEPEGSDAPDDHVPPDTATAGGTEAQGAAAAAEDATPEAGAPAGDTEVDAREPKERRVRTGTSRRR